MKIKSRVLLAALLAVPAIAVAVDDAGVTMAGMAMKYPSLKKGDVIDMWVPHSRFGLYGIPGGPKLTVVSKETL